VTEPAWCEFCPCSDAPALLTAFVSRVQAARVPLPEGQKAHPSHPNDAMGGVCDLSEEGPVTEPAWCEFRVRVRVGVRVFHVPQRYVWVKYIVSLCRSDERPNQQERPRTALCNSVELLWISVTRRICL